MGSLMSPVETKHVMEEVEGKALITFTGNQGFRFRHLDDTGVKIRYLLFDSHHPLEHKLGVIRTLNQRADTVPTTAEHIRGALKICGCQNL